VNHRGRQVRRTRGSHALSGSYGCVSGERAYKPDSVRRPPASQRMPRRSFLWAADCPAAQAAYPRVLTGRASPPLLFGLAPRGVCRAPDVATGAVGSYPTVSPLPSAAAIEDLPEDLPPADHRGRRRRRFVFCGTVRSRAVTGATPWRYQARCPAESGLSSRSWSCDQDPAITRPAHRIYYTAVAGGYA